MSATASGCPAWPGKTDLIPGRTNQMWFQTNQQGLFLGQCAEYCGTQHAHMLLRVNVDSPAAFRSWLDDQKKPAADDRGRPRGPGRVPVAVVRQLPPRARHDRRGNVRPGPDAPDEPADAGLRDGSQHARSTCGNG